MILLGYLLVLTGTRIAFLMLVGVDIVESFLSLMIGCNEAVFFVIIGMLSVDFSYFADLYVPHNPDPGFDSRGRGGVDFVNVCVWVG